MWTRDLSKILWGSLWRSNYPILIEMCILVYIACHAIAWFRFHHLASWYPYTLLKSDVTRRDHVVHCHGSQECWFTLCQFRCQFHSRRHSLRITLKHQRSQRGAEGGGGGQLSFVGTFGSLSVHVSRQVCHLYRQSLWSTNKIFERNSSFWTS